MKVEILEYDEEHRLVTYQTSLIQLQEIFSLRMRPFLWKVRTNTS